MNIYFTVDQFTVYELKTCPIADIICKNFRIRIRYHNDAYWSDVVDLTVVDSEGYYPIIKRKLGDGPKGHFGIKIDDNGKDTEAFIDFHGFHDDIEHPYDLPTAGSTPVIKFDFIQGATIEYGEFEESWNPDSHYNPEEWEDE